MSTRFSDDAAVIERLLAHIDAGATDLADGVWRQPVEHYLCPDRFQAELSKVLRRTATPFCPSLALPDPGSYIAREAALTPLLVVRGQDGQVRAFRNACRHRGARLADGDGCRSVFTCPYHAWTYGLDGRLRGVPHEHGFPGLDKDQHGLAPVRAFESSGLVWVNQDAAEAPDTAGLPEFVSPGMRLLSAGRQEVPVNWKIFVDGLLEGYHIRFTHAETFYPRQYDNITVVEHVGRNSRVSYPYRAIEKQRQAPPGERSARRALTYLTHLFPNAAMATFPTHCTLTVVEPLAVDRSVVVSYTLSDFEPGDEIERSVRKGRDFVTEGTREDQDMAVAVQRGLAARANAVFTFGLFEGALTHFHRGLAERIAEG